MQVIVLSPHRDDAAFSCGLLLHGVLREGTRVALVNVCTVSRYAPYLPAEGGNAPEADLTGRVTSVRRFEDEKFMETLCRTAGVSREAVELIDLEWQDVPLRWNMGDNLALARLDLRAPEVLALRRSLATLPPADLVLAPMALGGHIDHRLVLGAATESFPASSLAFYEDLPYACSMSETERIGIMGDSQSHLSEVWLPSQAAPAGLKQEYAVCYRSQIAPELATEMEAYATKNGGKERFAAAPNVIQKLRAIFSTRGRTQNA